MIYVMGEAPTGVVKIGTAVNPVERLKQIQAGHPQPLRVQLAMPGDRHTEAWLHEHFAQLRVSEREWFDFGDEDATCAVVAALAARNATPQDAAPAHDAEAAGAAPDPDMTAMYTSITQAEETVVLDYTDDDGTGLRIIGPLQGGWYHVGVNEHLDRGVRKAIGEHGYCVTPQSINELARIHAALGRELARVAAYGSDGAS